MSAMSRWSSRIMGIKNKIGNQNMRDGSFSVFCLVSTELNPILQWECLLTEIIHILFKNFFLETMVFRHFISIFRWSVAIIYIARNHAFLRRFVSGSLRWDVRIWCIFIIRWTRAQFYSSRFPAEIRNRKINFDIFCRRSLLLNIP